MGRLLRNMSLSTVRVRVRVSVRVTVIRRVVPAGTGPIDFGKHRFWGALNYDAAHLAQGPLMHHP